MKVIVSGRNIDVTDAIRTQIETKLERFDKFFRSDIEAYATVGSIKGTGSIEITIPLKNGAIIRAEEKDNDLYAALDMAVDKLSKQIKKHKTKLEKQYRSHDTIKFEAIPNLGAGEAEDSHEIVKTKSFPVKPMAPEEAVLQMELLGHNFFVFLNGETDEVNVVYARKDGKFGLIEPQV
ncbi:MAG: ribosome-associated translation inhibitor RaiA [Clostridia bacterium]|nr:ribosome-associated translation inhibitor RaiA [Clostridia bacterium]